MDDELEREARRLFARIRARYRCSQIIAFSGDGAFMLAAETPIDPRDLALFAEALTLVERVEATREKPFVEHDRSRRFLVTAMEEASNLYYVVIGPNRIDESAHAFVAIDGHDPKLRWS